MLYGGWIQGLLATHSPLGIITYCIIIIAVLALAPFIAKATAHFSLYSTLNSQLSYLGLMLGAFDKNKNNNGEYHRKLLAEDYAKVSKKLQTLQGDTRGQKSRQYLHTIMLFGSFIIALLGSTTLAQCLCLMGIFSSLWFISAVDIDHNQVPEKPLFILGLILAWITLSQSAASWTTPTNAFLGIVLTTTITSISWIIVWMNKKSRLELVIFGDGDTLALIVLALYFGADTIIILGGASLVFTIICLAAKGYESFLLKWGHYPERLYKDIPALPFMPAIYAGTAIMISIHHYFSLNPIINMVYQKLLSADA